MKILVMMSVGEFAFNINIFYPSIDEAIITNTDYFRVQTLPCMSGVGFPWQGCTYTCILKTLSTFAAN